MWREMRGREEQRWKKNGGWRGDGGEERRGKEVCVEAKERKGGIKT